MNLYVLVKVFQLVIDEVKLFISFEAAKGEFKRYTGKDYSEFEKSLERDELLGKTQGTQIYEVELDVKDGIHISKEDIVENLAYGLKREPNEEEICKFKAYVESDVPQWLSDNRKAFMRNLAEEEAEQHEITDEELKETH